MSIATQNCRGTVAFFAMLFAYRWSHRNTGSRRGSPTARALCLISSVKDPAREAHVPRR